MSSPSESINPAQPAIRKPSISMALEDDAWQRYPELARRLQRRKLILREQERRERKQRWGFAVSQVYRWQHRGLMALCLLLTALFLVRTGTAEAQSADEGEWGLQFLGGGQQQHSVALDTLIDADINGLVARIEVQQRFRNTGRSWSEAIYRFPLPVGAAVDRLLVRVGDRIIEGEIQQREVAHRLYQQALNTGVLAALVEQQRANQFETRLANIEPDAEISVSISFLQRVDFRQGEFSLQIPLTFTPRWDPVINHPLAGSTSQHPGDQRFGSHTPLDDHKLELRLKLRSALELSDISSRFHDMDIHPGVGGYDLALVNPDTRTDRMFELSWAPYLSNAPQAALSSWDSGDAVYALLMLAPPLAEAAIPQEREVIFIIDTSGSMQGEAMSQAKAALYKGLASLELEDRFNVVEFNSESYTLFPASVAPDSNYLEEALNFIESLQADGGTNMAPALRDAMMLPTQPSLLRQIVFVTDGSVGNEQELLQQISRELGDSRLFTVSIGSAPNTGFMRKAAELGRGSHTHIGQLADVGLRMNELWHRIQRPALQDIEVDWGMTADYYPEIIPDLYAGEPLWLVARLPSQPRNVLLRGNLNGTDWEQETGPHAGAGNESLATLWARGRVEALQDSRLFFNNDAATLRQSIVDVALEFGLLTPYTSLVAVDRTPTRPASANLMQDNIGNLLPAGSAMQVQGFSSTATHWQPQLLGAVLLMLLTSGMLWFAVPARPRRARGSPFTPASGNLPAGGSPRQSLPSGPGFAGPATALLSVPEVA